MTIQASTRVSEPTFPSNEQLASAQAFEPPTASPTALHHVSRVFAPATVRPNPSLHPGPATAGAVSPACATGSIVTHRAYSTCLRGPGELER